MSINVISIIYNVKFKFLEKIVKMFDLTFSNEVKHLTWVRIIAIIFILFYVFLLKLRIFYVCEISNEEFKNRNLKIFNILPVQWW